MQDEGFALYRRFLAGDEKGLEELIALYQRPLLRFIYGYLYDFALAEDILQETFIALYFQRSFQPKENASFKTYVYQIARNKSLNALKKRKRKQEISLDAFETPPAFLSYPFPETAEDKQRNALLRSTLRKIKPEYQETLILRYYDNLSPAQISAVTKKSIKRVYNLLARGKTALKIQLQKDGIRYEDL